MSDSGQKRWVLPNEAYPREWAALGRELGIPSAALSVLWNRGLRSSDEITRFLNPTAEHLENPFLLLDLATAVDRIRAALAARERIAVFGDYDVDGITAAVLFTRVLRHLGAPVEVLAPDRMRDGFGLSLPAIENAHALGATVMIVADCGTTAHVPAERARALGIDLIVADHHVPDDVLAPVHALVNPFRPGDTYPFRELAAVGVSFKILQGLVERVGSAEERAFLLRQFDLVALGTVADVVPLRGENRIFVHLGLQQIQDDPCPGTRALLAQAGLEETLLDAGHLAYFLSPRLNACGRLGAPLRAVQLLLSETDEEARAIAEALEQDNRERRRLNERVLADALRMIGVDSPEFHELSIVLGSPDWHPGVLGIAASRLAERFRVPAVLISLQGEVARGSGRTPPGIDLLGLISSSSGHLSGFGGHRHAVGFSLAPSEFQNFRTDLFAAVAHAGTVPQEDLLRIDGELDPQECTFELLSWFERMAPFGAGNPEPVFHGRAFCVGARVQQGRHLRMRIGSGRRATDCIGFGLGFRAAEVPGSGTYLQVAYQPTINRHRGEERVQLKIREFRLAESAAPQLAASQLAASEPAASQPAGAEQGASREIPRG